MRGRKQADNALRHPGCGCRAVQQPDGQVHAIGGFVGEADYERELAEFVPYLRGEADLGRATDGLGEGVVEVLEPSTP